MTDKITLKTKVQLMDEATVQRTLMRLSYEIVEKNPDTSRLALVGIETRGVPMAEILRNNIRRNTGIELPLGSINIKYYRDDLEKIADNPQLQKADLPFSVDGMHIILVDDVLIPAGQSEPRSKPYSTSDVRRRSLWLCSLTAVTVNCRSVRTMSAKMSRLPTTK